MPGMRQHHRMAEASYQALPEWQRAWWDFSLANWEGLPCFARESFPSREEKIAAYCLTPDAMGWEWPRQRKHLYRPLLLFHEKLIPHGPPDRDFNPVWVSFTGHDQVNHLSVLRYYTEKFVSALVAGKFDRSAVFAGILGHIVQDSCFPSHALPNGWVSEFCPGPPGLSRHVHQQIDCASVTPPRCRPRLLGTSGREIAFRLWAILEGQIRWCGQNACQVVDAVYEGDEGRLAALLQPACNTAVEAVAGLWHSGICAAAGRIDDGEKADLETVCLLHLIPYFVHPGGDYDVRIPGSHSVVNGSREPLFIDDGRRGPNAVRQVQRGLGLTSFVSLKYLVDCQVHRRFTCQAGLSPVYRDGQTENTRVHFTVETDRNVNRMVALDLNYGTTTTVYEGTLGPGEVLDVDASLEHAATLIIGALAEPEDKGGCLEYPFPHVVVAEPTLLKS